MLENYARSLIHEWLTGQRAALSELGSHADQDVYHYFACEGRPEQLFELLRTPEILFERAFIIASAICDRIDWLLDVDDLPDEVRDEDDRKNQLKILVTFVRDHRTEFDAYDEYGCLAAYTTIVIPLTRKMA